MSGADSASVANGVGLLLDVAGGLFLLLTLLCYTYPRVQHLEEELPDFSPSAG
jgi:hypothetical protein